MGQPHPCSSGSHLSESDYHRDRVSPALLTETYDDYLTRLRAFGWLGVATTIELDEADQDPAYPANGVPCTNIRPYTVVTPYQPATFYINPPIQGVGGSDSSSWECRAGDITPASPGDCEYDKLAVPDYSWEVGSDYGNQARYDQVCAEAWTYFGSVGGPDPVTVAQILPIGPIMNPDVRAYLTGDGHSVIEDWRKAEWGPFTISSAGQAITYVVHAYMRADGSEVRTGYDFKIKIRTDRIGSGTG